MNFEFDTSIVFAAIAAAVCIPVWLVIKSIKLAITLTMLIGLGGLAVYFLS